MLRRMQLDPGRSIAILEDALAIYEEHGVGPGPAFALLHLGLAVYVHDDQIRGERLIEESLCRMRAIGSPRLTAMAQGVLGWTARDRGESERAIRLTVDALAVHQRLGVRWHIAWNLLVLADAALMAGQFEQGVRLMGASQAQSDRLGSTAGGDSFDRARAQTEELREDERFDAIWVQGYNLDQAGAVQLGLSLRDAQLSRKPPDTSAGPDFSPLTPRELEVARLLAAGHTDREIADELFIAPGTVGVHVHNILRKLELESRVQVAVWITERHLPGPTAG
jgi:non-specific serine/threonine protein kinase